MPEDRTAMNLNHTDRLSLVYLTRDRISFVAHQGTGCSFQMWRIDGGRGTLKKLRKTFLMLQLNGSNFVMHRLWMLWMLWNASDMFQWLASHFERILPFKLKVSTCGIPREESSFDVAHWKSLRVLNLPNRYFGRLWSDQFRLRKVTQNFRLSPNASTAGCTVQTNFQIGLNDLSIVIYLMEL